LFWPSSVEEKYQSKFIEEGLVSDVLHMAIRSDIRIQLEASKLITNLSSMGIFNLKLFDIRCISTNFICRRSCDSFTSTHELT